MIDAYSDLRRTISDYLAPIEAREGVDDDAERRLNDALSGLDREGEDVDIELPALLADLAYRACIAADAAPDRQRVVDSVLDVTTFAVERLATDEQGGSGPGGPFEHPVFEYTYAIREREYDAGTETRLLAAIDEVRDTLGPHSTTIHRSLAYVLVDLIGLTWAQIGRPYSGKDHIRVQRSFTRVSEAVLAVFGRAYPGGSVRNSLP